MRPTRMLNPQDGHLKCSACAESEYEQERDQMFPTADTLWAHIATVHSLWIPFECILCPFTLLPTENMLKEHYNTFHPGKVPKAIYTYVEKKKLEIEDILLKSQNMDKCSEMVETSSTEQCSETGTEGRSSQQPQHKNQLVISATVLPTSDSEEEKEVVMEIKNEAIRLNEGNQIDRPINQNTPSKTKEIKKPKKRKADQNAPAINLQSSAAKHAWCNLCSIFLTSNTSYHTWRHHMGASKRFSCKTCTFSTSHVSHMELHCRRKHDLVGIAWTDQTAALKQQYARQYTAAFRSLREFGKKRKPLPVRENRPSRICSLCDRTVYYCNEHIWRFYMAAKRYACSSCDYGSCSAKDVKRHLRLVGHGDPAGESSWKDNTKRLSVEYEKMYAEAFCSTKR